VNVVPMDSERVLANQTVIVRDGKIVELGDAAKIHLPPEAMRIDGRGKYLLPGLADMHVHVQSESELSLAVAHGVTTIRDLFGSPYKTVWRDRIAKGEMFGPTIYTAGPIMDGARPDMGEMTRVTTAEEAERVVAEQKQRGYDFIKVYHKLSKEAYDAILIAAKKHKLPVTGHVTRAVELEGAFKSGQNCIEHLEGYGFAMQRPDSPYFKYSAGEVHMEYVYLHSIRYVDETKIPALAAATRAAGVWNCPTLVAYRNWGLTVAEAKAHSQQPEMKYVHPLLRAQWSPQYQAEVPYSDTIQADEDAALMKRRVELHKKLTKALSDAGAGVLLGTDAGVPYAIPGLAALEELELLVSAGLTPYQALKTGTSNPAEYLNASSQFGTVSVGKRADLILVEGHPLQDVSALRRRVGVMLRGRWLPESELRRGLDGLIAGYHAPQDWFKDMPELPSTGQREFWARYAITSFGLPKGEERLAVEKLPDGRQLVVSQFATWEPEERFSVRMEGNEKLSINSHGREGRGSIEWRLENQRLSAHGTLPVAGAVRLEEPVPAEMFLSAPGIAASVWLHPKVKALAVNQSLTLPVREWDFGPAFNFSRRTWKVKRLPNASRHRVYAIEVAAAGPLYRCRLTMDEHGWPAALEIQQGEGRIKYQRMEN
jgi:imidazolonepropionase-like amidohydrolase